MDTKKINLEGLKNVLSPKEMKNVKGGSCSDGFECYCGSNFVGCYSDPNRCLNACGI